MLSVFSCSKNSRQEGKRSPFQLLRWEDLGKEEVQMTLAVEVGVCKFTLKHVFKSRSGREQSLFVKLRKLLTHLGGLDRVVRVLQEIYKCS